MHDCIKRSGSITKTILNRLRIISAWNWFLWVVITIDGIDSCNCCPFFKDSSSIPLRQRIIRRDSVPRQKLVRRKDSLLSSFWRQNKPYQTPKQQHHQQHHHHQQQIKDYHTHQSSVTNSSVVKQQSTTRKRNNNYSRDNNTNMTSISALSSPSKDKVCIIGSGNWGSAIATIIGKNCELLSDYYETDVNMWVFEENITLPDGTTDKLTNIINTKHENVKYLPGIPLPHNIRAVSSLEDACTNATLLIFILPHQFLPKLIPTIRQTINKDNKKCRGVSLIKGLGAFD
jgi:NAD-dependent glycerol-3-phosphate dehydrogenase N-terminus